MNPPDGWTWQESLDYAKRVVVRTSLGFADWHDATALANYAVFKAFRSYRPLSAWKTLLFRSAGQLGRRHARRVNLRGRTLRGGPHQPDYGLVPRIEPLSRDISSRHFNPTERLEYEELLDAIPPSCREMLTLVVDGYTARQAVKAIGLTSNGNYTKRIKIARAALIAAGYEPPRLVAGEPARPKTDCSRGTALTKRSAQDRDRAAGTHIKANKMTREGRAA